MQTTTQNARQLMATMLVQNGPTKAVDLAYTYDSNARITSITDGAPAVQTSLTGSYTYDALDNIRRKQLGSRVVEMEYNTARRLSRARDTDDGNIWRNYAYDSRGSVTDNGRLGFTYDRANQPTAMTGTGVSGNFIYDGNFKRAKQTMGGDVIYSVYGASGALIHRDNATATVATDYVTTAGRTIARVENNTPTYSHADHLGSPIAGTTAGGAIAWRDDYTPFGEKRLNPLGNRDRAGFTGHIDDAATGLTYMQARYYDPNIGRFLSKDPIDFAAGGVSHFGRYAYVGNNPINGVDPTGMQESPLGGEAEAARRIREMVAEARREVEPRILDTGQFGSGLDLESQETQDKIASWTRMLDARAKRRVDASGNTREAGFQIDFNEEEGALYYTYFDGEPNGGKVAMYTSRPGFQNVVTGHVHDGMASLGTFAPIFRHIPFSGYPDLRVNTPGPSPEDRRLKASRGGQHHLWQRPLLPDLSLGPWERVGY